MEDTHFGEFPWKQWDFLLKLLLCSESRPGCLRVLCWHWTGLRLWVNGARDQERQPCSDFQKSECRTRGKPNSFSTSSVWLGERCFSEFRQSDHVLFIIW